MSLQLGSSGLMVGAWTATMLTRFKGYAVGVEGKRLKNDWYFGYDEEKVQREYQLRTGQRATGVVSDKDLHNLGLLPTLFSVHGTGQADPFGIGYPADIARRVLDLYWWQPVGNYPASAVPMNGSVDRGVSEKVNLLNDRKRCPGPFADVDYSQGSIVNGRVRNRVRSGDLVRRNVDFLGAASFGNPMRPAGSYAGNVDPGGEGIDPVREPIDDRCVNLAAKGDIYTTCPNNGVGEMMRSVFNLVFSRFFGKDSIVEQLFEMFTNPTRELANAAIAAWNGGLFVARGTSPHVLDYHTKECPGTGLTYYEYAVKHLRDLATTRLERIASSA